MDTHTPDTENIPIEHHPWPPFIPENAKILIMGTFPPPRSRWSMDFYYPNRTNDFWYMMGLIFRGDKFALYNRETGTFDLEAIKTLLLEKGIALSDTGREVHRLRGNASDKFLEILRPVPLNELLLKMPECKTIATTGEKASGIVAAITGTFVPRMGTSVKGPHGLTIWRMPSTSRAYPMPLVKKAEVYKTLFESAGLI